MRRVVSGVAAGAALFALGACLATIDEGLIRDEPAAIPELDAATPEAAADGPASDGEDPLLSLDDGFSCSSIVRAAFFFCSTLESGAPLFEGDFGVGGATIWSADESTSPTQSLRAAVVAYPDAGRRGALRTWVAPPQGVDDARLGEVSVYVNVLVASNPMPRADAPSIVTVERSDGRFDAPENVVFVGLAMGSDHAFVHAGTSNDLAARRQVGARLPTPPIGVWRRLRIRLRSAGDRVTVDVAARERGKAAEHLVVDAPVEGATSLGGNMFVSLGIADVGGTTADGVLYYDDLLVFGR